MAEKKYYAVWVYSLPSGKYVKGHFPPMFTNKADAIRYAELYLMDNKCRGAEVIRCPKNNPNCMMALNGNEPVLNYCYSDKQKKVVRDAKFDRLFD